MPHTSHKKKLPASRRQLVIQEDGWTKVASGNSLTRSTQCPDSNKSEAVYDPSRNRLPNPPEDMDDFIWRPYIAQSLDAPIAAGVTLASLQQSFDKAESRWLKSEACQALQHQVERWLKQYTILGRTVDRCIVLGTGTMSGSKAGWAERHHVALLQVAAFKSVAETISNYYRGSIHEVEYYAQEPVYNDLDAEFLQSHHIQTVYDPNAFDLITRDSFVYTPGAELDVQMRTLYKTPALHLTSKLDFYWRNEKGEALTDRKASSVRNEKGEIVYGNDGRDLFGPQDLSDPHSREENDNECRILEQFRSDHEETQIPDFDAQDYPFYHKYLYWYQQQQPNDGNTAVDAADIDLSTSTNNLSIKDG